MALPLLGNFGRALASRGLDPITGNAIAPVPPVTPTGKIPMDVAVGGGGQNPFQGLIDAIKGFDITPAPTSGQGPYGKVPGPIGYPTTPYAEATKIYPGLDELKGLAGNEIRSQLLGEFTPQEEAALWNTANTYGVQSGMPGAQLWSNRFMGNRIEEGMKRRQMGVQNYQSLLAELSKLGVDPALAAEIAARNANMAAAPDPEAAAKELLKRFAEGLGNLGNFNPGGGNYGGGGFSPPYINPAAGTVARPASPSGGFQFGTSTPGATKPAVATSRTIYDNNDWANLWGNTPQGTPMGSPTLSYDSPWLSTVPDTGGLWSGYGSPSLGYDSSWGGYTNTASTPSLSYDDTNWGGFGTPDYGVGSSLFGDTSLFGGDEPYIDPWEAYFDEYGY